MSMPNTKATAGSPRFAELDGLRALAVGSVVLFHCDIPGLADAGFFGVDVFFMISGFIITALLLKEYRKAGHFDFLNFYFRRLKRLLPPVLGVIFLAFLVTPMISPDAFARLSADAPSALFYYSNWWQVFEKQDYFDTTPHILKHLWSLAVEEQFYIVWPPIAYAVLKRRGARATGLLALSISVLSTAWMWYRYQLNVDSPDQNRIYLGTDTHAMGLLMGAALACFWNPWAVGEVRRFARRVWRPLALAALGLLVTMIAVVNTSDPRLYQGSFFLVAILTCVVAWGTMNDRDFVVSRLLRTRVVQWIGLRSYSIYLIHWPIFVWARLLGLHDLSRPTVLVPVLALVVVLAEAMYRWIEMPFSHLDLKSPGALPKVGTLAAYAIVSAGLSWVSFTLGPQAPPASVVAQAAPSASPVKMAAGIAAPVPAQGVPLPLPAAAQAGSATPAVRLGDPPDANARIAGGEQIYAIGDSVLLGASTHLTETIPGIRIDAAVGRQASQGLKVAQQWHGKLGSGSTVLVHLGTNGYINEGQYRDLLKELADCKVVLVVNVHADRRWTSPNNEIIDRMAHEFPNVHLVDWRLVSASRPDYFVKDGIHLTHAGILALASQIKFATGGSVLPDLAPGTMLASAPTHRVSHPVHALDPAPGPASASVPKESAMPDVSHVRDLAEDELAHVPAPALEMLPRLEQ